MATVADHKAAGLLCALGRGGSVPALLDALRSLDKARASVKCRKVDEEGNLVRDEEYTRLAAFLLCIFQDTFGTDIDRRKAGRRLWALVDEGFAPALARVCPRIEAMYTAGSAQQAALVRLLQPAAADASPSACLLGRNCLRGYLPKTAGTISTVFTILLRCGEQGSWDCLELALKLGRKRTTASYTASSIREVLPWTAVLHLQAVSLCLNRLCVRAEPVPALRA